MHKHSHRGHYSFLLPPSVTKYNISRHNGIRYNQTSVKLSVRLSPRRGAWFRIRNKGEQRSFSLSPSLPPPFLCNHHARYSCSPFPPGHVVSPIENAMRLVSPVVVVPRCKAPDALTFVGEHRSGIGTAFTDSRQNEIPARDVRSRPGSSLSPPRGKSIAVSSVLEPRLKGRLVTLRDTREIHRRFRLSRGNWKLPGFHFEWPSSCADLGILRKFDPAVESELPEEGGEGTSSPI